MKNIGDTMEPEIQKMKISNEIRRWIRKQKEGGDKEWHRTLAEIKRMQKHTQQK